MVRFRSWLVLHQNNTSVNIDGGTMMELVGHTVGSNATNNKTVSIPVEVQVHMSLKTKGTWRTVAFCKSW